MNSKRFEFLLDLLYIYRFLSFVGKFFLKERATLWKMFKNVADEILIGSVTMKNGYQLVDLAVSRCVPEYSYRMTLTHCLQTLLEEFILFNNDPVNVVANLDIKYQYDNFHSIIDEYVRLRAIHLYRL